MTGIALGIGLWPERRREWSRQWAYLEADKLRVELA